ncbi:DUF2325 domain-containing protein [Beggiatoa leptomitoformis]|uniref:DUF2325 domain-containing protein n=1 Tax=Beggiatoa leptomitoformis TaxID=288004 RepID=A0A2N9YBS1_9GAMM|nr:DUF2325 domain-containing protein [Beggiatoa leptomitoformis]ALG66756.1 DUF2325 domain-containing protein [Beggiatoa leptomitoformis]AUI67901.1 DUF2325 domain-containing protein [Beggiatoa leptomitoformis]
MVILVGADRLGNIENVLKERGLSEYRHITGRCPKAQKCSNTYWTKADLMILFTDFVGHNVMRNFRQQAKDQQIPFIACKRSVCDLARCLDKCGYIPQHGCSATHCPCTKQ